MTLYAVEAELYVEASSPDEAEAFARSMYALLRRFRNVSGSHVRGVAVGLSREATEDEVLP